MADNFKTIKSVNPDHEFEIIVNHTSRVISVGKWETTKIFHDYTRNENDYFLKDEVLKANDITLQNTWQKEHGLHFVHKEIASYLGHRFNYRIRAASYNLWIKPIKAHCDKYCFYSNGHHHFYSKSQIKRLWKHKRKVDTLIDDGLDHLVPLVIYFGGSPKTLKEKLGKSLWKTLANNSLYKNKLVVRLLEMIIRDEGREGRFTKFKQFLTVIRAVAVLKVSLIKNAYFTSYFYWPRGKQDAHGFEENIPRLSWLNTYAPTSNYQKLHFYNGLYLGTQNIARTFPGKFNPNWSPRTMREQNRKLSILLFEERIKEKCLSGYFRYNLRRRYFDDEVELKETSVHHLNFNDETVLKETVDTVSNHLKPVLLKNLNQHFYIDYFDNFVDGLIDSRFDQIVAILEKNQLLRHITDSQQEPINTTIPLKVYSDAGLMLF